VLRSAIPHLSPHAFRHTYGHRYLAASGDIHKLSRTLGHASGSLTEKHYAYLLKENLRDAVDVLELKLGLPKVGKDGKVLGFKGRRLYRRAQGV
jgi:integrase